MKNKTVKSLLITLAALLMLAAGAFCIFKGVNAYKLQNCPHEYWDNGVCQRCGYVCEHDWSRGVCFYCGTPCDHIWEDGVCGICKLPCRHERDGDTCTLCGYVCPHDSYVDSVCELCGIDCEHRWVGDMCADCHVVCTHERHDTQGICERCGMRLVHRFISGVCACGAEPLSYSTPLPEELYAPCSQQGSVTVVNYYAPLYSTNSVTVGKVMSVYLPYGYDENKKYNVLVMVHGGEGNNTDWLDNSFVMDDGTVVCMKNLYDNMIQQRIIEPLIIVTPYTDSYVNGGGFMDTGPEQFAPELRNYILPYIVENYSTYAQGSSPEQIRAAREHFGIGGNSNGSLYAYNAGLVENLDLLANFICLSGSNNASGALRALESQDYTVDYLYAGAGSFDPQKDNALRGYDYIVENSAKLTEGENAKFELICGGHTWNTWSTAFFNAAQLMFPKG